MKNVNKVRSVSLSVLKVLFERVLVSKVMCFAKTLGIEEWGKKQGNFYGTEVYVQIHQDKQSNH